MSLIFCRREKTEQRFFVCAAEPSCCHHQNRLALTRTKHISAPLFPRRLSLSRRVCRQSKTRGGGGFQRSLMSLLALVWVLCFPPADSILKTVKYSTELQVVHGNVNSKAVMRLARGDDSVYEMCTQTHTDAELRAHL